MSTDKKVQKDTDNKKKKPTEESLAERRKSNNIAQRQTRVWEIN